ncbi:MAG: SdiA-regulated domain-containing protein [Cyclobacteriaceae bacterium]
MKSLTFISLLTFLISCGTKKRELKKTMTNKGQISLSHELNEVSGLTFFKGDLLAVQDEKGIIFTISSTDGSIIKKQKVLKGGDYEGITTDEKKIFILRSDGAVYVIENGQSNKLIDKQKGKEFEGICYDKKNHYLLLGLKQHPDNKKDKSLRVYAYDFTKKKLLNDPVIKLEKKAFEKDFKISGMDFHPNGNLFILSSHSSSLLELTADFTVMRHTKLARKTFPQAEGIAIRKDGSIFISNERTPGKHASLQRL